VKRTLPTIIFSTIPLCDSGVSIALIDSSFKNRPRFTIKIAELAVFRLDLADIDFRMMSEDVLPPILLVQLLEMNMNSLLVLYS
jgi:hypothetical protein